MNRLAKPKQARNATAIQRGGLLSQGSTEADILVICDPPSDTAFRSGAVMDNRAMNKLIAACNTHGINKDDVAFLTTAPPVPEEYAKSAKKKGDHLAEYSQEFDLQMQTFASKKIVVCMGALASRQATGRAVKITTVRGTSKQVAGLDCPVLYCLSPAMVVTRPENEDMFNADIGALKRIQEAGFSLRRANMVDIPTQYRWVVDLDEAMEAHKGSSILAVDIEGVGFNTLEEGYRTLCVQITPSAGISYLIPTDYEYYSRQYAHHQERLIDLKEREAAGEELPPLMQKLLKEPPYPKLPRRGVAKLTSQLKALMEDESVNKVGHNFKFDVHAMKSSFGIEVKGWNHDTLQMAFAVDDNMMIKSLSNCTRRWCPALAGYSDEFDATTDKGAMQNVPLFEMVYYGGGDTDATYRVASVLYRELSKDKRNKKCYDTIQMPCLNMLVKMERNGVSVNTEALTEFHDYLAEEVTKEYAELIKMVGKPIKKEFVEAAKKSEKLEEVLKFSRPSFIEAVLFRSKKDGGRGIKPRMFTDSTKLLADNLKKPSTSASHLAYFVDDPFVHKYLNYSKMRKMMSTYVGKKGDPDNGIAHTGFWQYLKKDGKIHPSFFLSTTVTGRSSCIHEDSIVVTKEGPKRIVEVTPTDFAMTHKGNWKSIKHLIRKPKQDMYDLTLSNGEVLRCTEEHRLLTQEGKWVTIRDVYFKETLKRPEHKSENSRALRDLLIDHARGGEGGESVLPYGQCDTKVRDTLRKASETKSTKVLCLEEGGEKPHDWEEADKLQRAMLRQSGIFDGSSRWETLFRSPSCDGRYARHTCESFALRDGCPPHRRGHGEQSPEQPSPSNSSRAQRTAPTLQKEPSGVRITRVDYGGVHSVYDLTVEDDHSYLCAGVFNHNSKNPNGQNIPKRGELAKQYRHIFKASEGWSFVSADLSQAELRIAACMANEHEMIRIYSEHGDIHTATAGIVSGNDYDKIIANKRNDALLVDCANDWAGSGAYLTKLSPGKRETCTVSEYIDYIRQCAKAVNFGFIYGMWWKGFKTYAKTDYGIDFTDNEAKEIREKYFDTYPNLVSWHDQMKKFVKDNGFVRGIHGALRRLPSINSDLEGIQKQAERNAINSPVQRLGSDIGLLALTAFVRDCPEDEARPVLFIHDDNILEVKEGLEEEYAGYLKYYMESVPLEELFGVTLPVPIVAEPESGKTLGGMEELDHVKAVRPSWCKL